ncbi:MAG: hypothetical protein U1E36_07955 [Rickettsiales bacterium]
MSKLTHSEQIIAEKTVFVLLVRGESPDKKPIYAYVAVRADKLEEFMEAQKTGMFYPEDYGVIIESGEGEPAPEVREKMEKEYGFNHQLMVDIPDEKGASGLTQAAARIQSEAIRDSKDDTKH